MIRLGFTQFSYLIFEFIFKVNIPDLKDEVKTEILMVDSKFEPSESDSTMFLNITPVVVSTNETLRI